MCNENSEVKTHTKVKQIDAFLFKISRLFNELGKQGLQLAQIHNGNLTIKEKKACVET